MEKIDKKDVAAAIVLSGVMLVLYFVTLAPTIVVEGDGAEFAAAVAAMGIPHRPGYPTYLLLAKLFSLLPLGESLIWEMNLLSALFGAGTVGLVFLTMRLLGANGVSSALGSLLFAAGKGFWTQSIIAEVYTPLTFWLSGGILLLLLWDRARRDIYLLIFALWLGLGYGIHKTLLLITPLFLLYLLAKDRRFVLRLRFVIPVVVLLFAGASTYLYLPIQAQKKPLVNFASPDTIGNTISGLAFNPLAQSYGNLWGNLRSFATHWIVQYPLIGTLLGLVGLSLSFRSRDRLFELALLLAIFLATSLGFLYRFQFDPEGSKAYEYRVMYIPSYMIFSLWIAAGFTYLCAGVARIRAPRNALARFSPVVTPERIVGALCLGALIFYLSGQVKDVDKSKNYFSHDFGRNMFDIAAPDSIICTTGDNSFFPLLYLQTVEGMRRDVALVHLPLVHRQWYVDMVRNNYPEIESMVSGATLESFVEGNIEKRRVYVCFPFRFFDEKGSAFRLEPAGVLMRFARKDEAPTSSFSFQPKHLRGVYDLSIPRDMREMTIITYYSLAHYFLGNAYLDRGEFREALKEYELGLHYPPLSFSANEEVRKLLYLNTGVAYFREGRLEKAEGAWRSVLDMDPNNALAGRNLRVVEQARKGK